MRAGADPAAVFDALAARGRIRLHTDPAALQEAVAATAAVCYGAGDRVAVVVDTRQQAADLSGAIRDRLVARGRIDDNQVVTTIAGQRIGVGDRVATRRNDAGLGVANRETWTVTAVDGDGRLTVTPTAESVTPAGGAPGRQWVLPADYVTSHVELAYVNTAHGVQGDTVTAAHVVIGERTGAAAAYVGMTRGRTSNTAHLIAADLTEARAQWIAVFGRDRTDLGPAHAAQLAAGEITRYGAPRPLDAVLAELHAAWTIEQRCQDRLAIHEPMRAALQELAALQSDPADRLVALTGTYRQAASVAEQAKQRVETSDAAVAAEADRLREALLRRWDSERAAASAAARVVLDGAGRLGLRRGAVARAGEQLLDWADRWRPYVPELPSDPAQLAQVTGWFDDRPALWAALDAYARRAADHAHPERDGLRAVAEAAQRACEQARFAAAEARRQADERTARFGAPERTSDPETALAEVDHDIAATRQQLAAARARIAHLTAEPTLLAQPADRLAQERDAWRVGHDAERAARRTAVSVASPPGSTGSMRPPEPVLHRMRSPGDGPSIGR